MGRPATFDRDAALRSALLEFWAHGYKGTSTESLCQAMGMGRSSLYHAFHSKNELYKECMTTYLEQANQAVETIMRNEALTVFERFAALFENVVCEEIHRRENRAPSGCFGVNTVVETGAEPDLSTLTEQVAENFLERKESLATILRMGQSAGDITKTMTPEAQAEFVHGSIVGIRVAARVGSDRSAMVSVAQGALRALAAK
jgi:AcrR family transcriptional regulator